ncbi:MAG: prolyl oligopeptidase family protein, partial [Polaromonas sp.]|nr:prolyl oligopeptidase family protein [Polaromonas sp.]
MVSSTTTLPIGRSAAVGLLTILATLAAAPAFARPALTPTACAALARGVLPGGRVLSAEPVAAGMLKVAASPIAPDLAQRVATMPAFCRVQAVATPTPDSQIGIEVWLPLRGWNGRLLGTGNGGGAGKIAYEMGMVEGLKRGFAVT